ncbi:MAG: hypothetical protein KDA92_03270 [Planctomycetales bacterium]|nr:hypothetical protein [Planctomycetales bacterium]MCA9166769.1 hypothetical protein [Planctomycetales bacterium]
MEKIVSIPDPHHPVDVRLKNPPLAALLAWLIPGAGHIYQRRYAKGILFMVTILATFFFGLAIGGGKVVYASFRAPDMRYPYLCQVGVGIPALPALIQRHRVIGSVPAKPPLWNGFMAPPRQPVREQENDELGDWHRGLKTNFELGTLYTMIAGLLNILVIYDAYAGPMYMATETPTDKPPPPDSSPPTS